MYEEELSINHATSENSTRSMFEGRSWAGWLLGGEGQ